MGIKQNETIRKNPLKSAIMSKISIILERTLSLLANENEEIRKNA